MAIEKLICKKEDNTGFTIIDWNSGLTNLPERYVAHCPVDPQTNLQIADLNLLTINRFYIDDAAEKHIVDLDDVIPTRTKILNPGMPGPTISGPIKYEEQFEVLINGTNLEVFHGTEIDKAKNTYIIKVIKDCDAKISQLKAGYSDSEVQSWGVKKQLATQWISLTPEYKLSLIDHAQYALIVNEAGGETNVEKVENTSSLAARILTLAAIFESYCGLCVRVKKTTIAEMKAIDDTLSGTKTQLQVIYSSITWPTL